MPYPFYNTAPPNPNTKNSITQTATDQGLRDFLLNKNLLPQYPFISTNVNGSPKIGEPVLDTSINNNSNVIPFGLPLEVEGLVHYNNSISPNKFKNDNPTAPSLVSIVNQTQLQGIFGNIDFPQGTQSYPTSATEQIDEFGILGKTDYADFRKKATLFNLYLDETKQIDVADLISLQPIGYSQQIPSYLDVFGGLNQGGEGSTQALNVIGSILNGQGLGLAKGGIVTNYDIRASIVGRILGSTGLINDTKLGIIGGQQLALALANNAAFNIQEEALGTLNVGENILSLIKDGNFAGFRSNYRITIPNNTAGRVANYTSTLLGFTIPTSYLTDSGSIFLSESNSGNIERANEMLLNTGRGQIQSLISNVNANIIGTTQFDNPQSTQFRSGYVPGYTDNRGEKAINSSLYAFFDTDKGTIYPFAVTSNNIADVIPEISYNRSEMIKQYGFNSPEDTFTGPNGNAGYDNRKISDVGFSWVSTAGNVNAYPNDSSQLSPANKKSLLTKTQKLFNSKGMLNIVTAKGDMGHTSSQIQTANGGGISKGSAVLTKNVYSIDGQIAVNFDQAENTYCRSWTTLDRYDTVNKLIRNSGLTETSRLLPYRFETTNSTLDSNGFVKIAPYITDKFNDSKSQVISDPKNYMFSIENLAWSDNWQDLPPVEVGNGDLLTGKRGRIMWFPPYNIQFNENSSVNWETTNFIGRGEPLYTYNNTERSGNLSFSIVVDHSSYVNSFRGNNGPTDNYVASFFAGCVDPDNYFSDKLTVTEKSAIIDNELQQLQTETLQPETPPPSFVVYYPNDTADIQVIFNKGYENGLMNNSPTPNQKIDYTINPNGDGHGIGSFVGGVTSQTAWNDRFNYGLNGWKTPINVGTESFSGFTDPNYITALSSYLDNECKYCVVKITSYASPQGNITSNNILANSRTQSIYDYFFQNLYNGKDDNYKKARILKQPNKALTAAESKCNPVAGSPTDTFACKSDRRTNVVFEFSNELATAEIVKPKPIVKKQLQQINTKITNRLYNEAAYFEKLTQVDKFVFDSFREKIRYFHPAFHSTTPEGLNSRLTFLQQCTRQGPTLEEQGANNLAFGRPPICILRIGDFYHTKIVIDNISIDYEPLVWDLNPEGIGVQPMIANVNISFKFIGASALLGPINKLQNALSFNYYANAHVYDPRADYLAKVPESNNSQIGSYVIVDGVKNVNDNPIITNTEIINNNQEPEINQIEDSNSVNGPESTPTADQPEPNNIIPEILGFKSVEILPNNNDHIINITLNQKGIFTISGGTYVQMITNDELVTFFNKGLKITLDTMPTPDINNRYEEIINSSNISLTNGKGLTNLFSGGFNLGDVYESNNFNVANLNNGNYMLKLYYNGASIGQIPVILNNNVFKYN